MLIVTMPERHINAVVASVQRGAVLLDSKNPTWFKKIKITRLCMSHGEYCILGQVYGDLETGIKVLGIKGDCARYGFDITDWADEHEHGDEEFELLEVCWKKVIKARKTA